MFLYIFFNSFILFLFINTFMYFLIKFIKFVVLPAAVLLKIVSQKQRLDDRSLLFYFWPFPFFPTFFHFFQLRIPYKADMIIYDVIFC